MSLGGAVAVRLLADRAGHTGTVGGVGAAFVSPEAMTGVGCGLTFDDAHVPIVQASKWQPTIRARRWCWMPTLVTVH